MAQYALPVPFKKEWKHKILLLEFILGYVQVFFVDEAGWLIIKFGDDIFRCHVSDGEPRAKRAPALAGMNLYMRIMADVACCDNAIMYHSIIDNDIGFFVFFTGCNAAEYGDRMWELIE